MSILTSSRDPARCVHREDELAGEPWLYELKAGQTLRILDLEGNQAVDTLFFNARDPRERYSATDTIRRQGKLYLTAGSRLMSTGRLAPNSSARVMKAERRPQAAAAWRSSLWAATSMT